MSYLNRCPECNGYGYLEYFRNLERRDVECDECGGTGEINYIYKKEEEYYGR